MPHRSQARADVRAGAGAYLGAGKKYAKDPACLIGHRQGQTCGQAGRRVCSSVQGRGAGACQAGCAGHARATCMGMCLPQLVCVYSFLYTSEGGRTNPTATFHVGTGYHRSAGLTHELALRVGHAACVGSFSKRVRGQPGMSSSRGPGLVDADRRGDGGYIHRRDGGRYGRPRVFCAFTADAVTCPY